MDDSEDTPAAPSLAELLVAMAEGTRARHEGKEEGTDLPWEPRRRGLPVMGCLFRLVLLVIVLIALVFGGLFLVLGGAFS